MPDTSQHIEVQRLIAKRGDHRTGHIVHLILSLITIGMWVPVWILVAISNAIERRKIDSRLRRVG